MLFAENGFHSGEKYDISGNFFVISAKNVSYLGKNVIYAENFLVCPENFFEMNSPPSPSVANISGQKILDALFYWKSAPQSLPPPTFRSFLRP
jgi:hypothetical protein